MPHLIRRQSLDITLIGTEADGLALQRRLPDLCQHTLMPVLEQVLDRHAPAYGHLVIARVDLDVGIFTLDRLAQDLPAALARALVQSLSAMIVAGSPLSGSPTPNQSTQHKTQAQSVYEAFVYFLNTGRLPWWFRLAAGDSLEQAVRSAFAAADELNLQSRVHLLLQTLVAPEARQRLLLQFSLKFVHVLLGWVSSAAQSVLAGVLRTLDEVRLSSSDRAIVTRQAYAAAFASLAIGHIPNEFEVLAQLVTQLLAISNGGDGLAQLVTQSLAVSTIDDGLAQLAMQPSQVLKTSKDLAQSVTQPLAVSKTSEVLATTFITAGRRKEGGQLGAEDAELKEGLYIDNAGLVLLHPFLPQFFAALNLVVDDVVINPDRALCLLYYLVTGQTIAPEYELVLPKILCGVALATPVAADVQLTTDECDEADALLAAVIRHWEALRNTGIDGLRGAFLLRAGKLSLREDGDWLLQIEANTADILLDALPWGIGMIKLVWMPHMLWVEWR